MNSEIVEKIKKLLRLGQSSNRHEAELAIQRAFELAARHNIDTDSIDLDEETRRILHKEFHVGQRFSFIRKLTIAILERFFNVSVVVARPNWKFIGKETDVEIAIYVHEFLVSACSIGLRHFERECHRKLSINKRNNYIAGFFYGISTKLGEAKEKLRIEDSKTALAVRDKERREEYIAENWKTEPLPLAHKSRMNRSAMMSGYTDGKNTEINKGLSGKTPERLQLSQ